MRPELARGAWRRHLWLKATSVVGVGITAIALMAQYGGGNLANWWDVGESRSMPLTASVDDPTGSLRIYNNDGGVRTGGHAFFEPIGTNGRACVTCHQPSNAMSLSTQIVQERWVETRGKDPVFAAIDGSNCPNLPQELRSSHSLLLDRGVFRIYLPWPGKAADGTAIKPDFKIEVVRDPTGCNTDPVYGLHSANPTISVYRRPRMVANLKYVLGSSEVFATGTSSVNTAGMLTADGREPSLEAQAIDAALAHEQAGKTPTEQQLEDILEFESQIYVAQDFDVKAGDLSEVDGPFALSAWNLGKGKVNAGQAGAPVFMAQGDWTTFDDGGSDVEKRAFRASVVRGNAIFSSREFAIGETANLHLPDGSAVPAHKAATGSCATCHSAPMTGTAKGHGWMDIGTTTQAEAQDAPDLPLFKITCNADAEPHPYLGRVIYTNDPGRALVTGKCKDVGSIVMQQFRGLSARAPYFANGSAKDLREVVDYYDRRFSIGLTERDKQDLINFMGVL
jgi:cytochrome c peroxidase